MDFILPDIGEGIETISVSEILIKENQEIKAKESVLLVETDKASMEIPIDTDCIITNILVNVGDLISPGTKILEYKLNNTNDSQIKKEEGLTDKETIKEVVSKFEENPALDNSYTKEEKTDKKIHDIKETNNDISHASPSIRKLARELNCNLDEIVGTGQNKRITKEDILNYINGNETKDDSVSIKSLYNDFLNWGAIEKVELNTIQKTSAKRLHKSWASIPHVTQFDEINIDKLYKLIKLLKKINKNPKSKVSYIPFFIKAVYNILKQLEVFNSSLDIDNKTIIKKHYYNIGFAVDTPRGLFVPVIKNVNNKSIKELTIEFNQLVNKAMDNKLTIDDMSGGCITISSLGNISGKFFTPIINPPEVAILGISKISIQAIYKNNKFQAQRILPISLSYDHRVINGADSAKFTKLFGEIINKPELLK
tara:strand:+ start:27677 stop:28951 length:1275 start_codon:yes stop_codon:yes gene_type:complete